MSMLLMVKAMQTKVGNPLRKLVLIKLADNANDQGECWPSYQYIADQCEISKRSVISHINALCESGLLTKIYRDGTLKGNSSNLYCLTIGGEFTAPPSANAAPPSANAAPPPSANAAPRISNSLEPVKEPVIKDTRKQKDAFMLPDGLNQFAWDRWIEYRKQARLKAYTNTPMSAGVQAKKLIEISGGDLNIQMMIVNQSIESSWSGLFPLKQQGFNGGRKLSNIEAAQQAAQAMGVVYDPDEPF